MPAKLSSAAGISNGGEQVHGKIAWKDACTFEPSWGFRSLPIIGENILGLVRFQSSNLMFPLPFVPSAIYFVYNYS